MSNYETDEELSETIGEFEKYQDDLLDFRRSPDFNVLSREEQVLLNEQSVGMDAVIETLRRRQKLRAAQRIKHKTQT